DILRWLGERRLASVQTSFSRVPGGGYVQDALRRDAAHLRKLLRRGAIVRVCGSRPMARGVAEALDGILATLHLSVQQLKAKGRYAEDLFCPPSRAGSCSRQHAAATARPDDGNPLVRALRRRSASGHGIASSCT